MRLIIFLLTYLTSYTLQALELPKGLSKTDRQKIVKEFGIPSSTKFLSNPYSLGGYPGIEVGASYSRLNTKEISLLGQQTTNNESSVSIIELSLGKGLYNDVDIFFNFAPFNHQDKIQTYGGMIRWSFYQAKFLPLTFSVSTTGHSIRISDTFVNETFALQLITGLNVDNISVFLGLGKAQGTGRFLGGPNGVLDNNANEEKEIQLMNQAFIGINIEYSNIFISAQIDRYTDTYFSSKLGLRF